LGTADKFIPGIGEIEGVDTIARTMNRAYRLE
jgi:hypothetical protein